MDVSRIGLVRSVTPMSLAGWQHKSASVKKTSEDSSIRYQPEVMYTDRNAGNRSETEGCHSSASPALSEQQEVYPE